MKTITQKVFIPLGHPMNFNRTLFIGTKAVESLRKKKNIYIEREN